jgi:branched-chain amino acid transport system substrate-binding protein
VALTASDAGVSPTTIEIGYIGDQTGVSSSFFANSLAGAQARVDAQNAAGGVDGRKLELVVDDDTSTPAGNSLAAENLVTRQKVFGVIDYNSFAFAGAKVLHSAGVPVTAAGIDGPEWGMQPYSNMFSFIPSMATYGGLQYGYDYLGKFLSSLGVHKLAGLAYGQSPSSQSGLKAEFVESAPYGIQQCYDNTSTPFGGTDFTAAALAIKSAGCDAVTSTMLDQQDVAISTAIKQGGIQATQIYATGYDDATLSSPGARQALEGAYFSTPVVWDLDTPAMQKLRADLTAYDPAYKAGSVPPYGVFYTYVATDLMIDGLEKAGANPTRANFISQLRQVNDYNANGLLASPIGFENFGTAAMVPLTSCSYMVRLQGGKFVVPGTQPICGKRVSFKP